MTNFIDRMELGCCGWFQTAFGLRPLHLPVDNVVQQRVRRGTDQLVRAVIFQVSVPASRILARRRP
ncbi:hypothetical protein LCGC14_0916550 [marine sediment metagenome]|uniref:Uncharacterized protein n=1 Tax=marine sediment metagenome TaxID=412755 RepID=A0A0F9NS64_9ZZZZ